MSPIVSTIGWERWRLVRRSERIAFCVRMSPTFQKTCWTKASRRLAGWMMSSVRRGLIQSCRERNASKGQHRLAVQYDTFRR